VLTARSDWSMSLRFFASSIQPQPDSRIQPVPIVCDHGKEKAATLIARQQIEKGDTAMKELYQSADWKKEKHVPAIEITTTPVKDQPVLILVSVGKEIAHPNTTEHHIEWIELYFHPAGEKFPYLLGRATFSCHAASAAGPNTSTVYSDPEAVFKLRTGKSGTIHAASYCNIHGLWTSSTELSIG
jgi:superoxide reductase